MADHGQPVRSRLDRAARLKAGESRGHALRHDHLALAGREPAAIGPFHLRTQLHSARGDTADERVRLARSIAARRADDEHQLRGNQRFAPLIAVDLFKISQGPKLFPADQAAGFRLRALAHDENIACITRVGIGGFDAPGQRPQQDNHRHHQRDAQHRRQRRPPADPHIAQIVFQGQGHVPLNRASSIPAPHSSGLLRWKGRRQQ